MTQPTYRVQRVSGMPAADSDLLEDLRSVAVRIGKQTVGLKEYRETGKYDDTTIIRHFG